MASNIVNSAINKVKVKGTTQRVFGWIIAVFNGFVVFAGCATSGFKEALDVAMVLFFSAIAAVGVWLIIKGNKKIKLIRTFYDYSARLSADTEKSIDLLASSTGTTVAVATKNISDMLAAGFFPNCYLDGQHNRLVVPAVSQQRVPAFSASVPNAATQRVKYTTVQCKNCGATNKVILGTVGECEYCGSPLE